ncbi:unnamed protein product [Discosporangium mesarthrocarpum]
MLDIEAPVNYEKAMLRYMGPTRSTAYEIPRTPTTICVSIRRLKVTFGDVRVSYSPIKSVIERQSRSSARGRLPIAATAFCTRPIRMVRVPRRIPDSLSAQVDECLLGTFNDSQVKVLKWVIGHGLTDPPSNSLYLYIYGPSGGEGKFGALNYLQLLLRGTISPVQGLHVRWNCEPGRSRGHDQQPVCLHT